MLDQLKMIALCGHLVLHLKYTVLATRGLWVFVIHQCQILLIRELYMMRCIFLDQFLFDLRHWTISIWKDNHHCYHLWNTSFYSILKNNPFAQYFPISKCFVHVTVVLLVQRFILLCYFMSTTFIRSPAFIEVKYHRSFGENKRSW